MQSQARLIESSDYKRSLSLVDAFQQLQPQPLVENAGKGKTLVYEDEFADHSMLLLDGWIALSKMLPDGETQIIDVMLPGDFALIGATNAPVAACSVVALSDVRFITIRPRHMNGSEQAMETIRELMAAEIVRSQARTAELLLRLGHGNAASRIAYTLLEFYVRLEAIGHTQAVGFNFPMTQHRFGEMVGLSNVHVCRTLRRFERDGVISHADQTTIVLDNINALCDIAGVDLDTLRHEILMQPTL